jgi:PAS domain S-box-containing protein
MPSFDRYGSTAFGLTTQVLDVLPAGAYVCDAEGVIHYYNRRAAELWGRAPRAGDGDGDEQFGGFLRTVAPDGRPGPHPAEAIAEALRSGGTRPSFEAVVGRPDGSRITVSCAVGALKNDSGEVIGAVNVFQDVSGQKWPLEESRQIEEGLRGLVAALPAAVYTTDREGRITLFNEAAVELWGRRPEVGKELWCGSFRIFRPDGAPLPHDRCPMAVALREGRSVRGEEIIVERPDGLRRHILPHPEPLRDASGAVVGAVNLLVDVTDRARAGVERNLLAAIVESSQDAIVSKTLDGIITSWNHGAEHILGYTAREAVGRHISLIIPPEQAEDVALILGRVRRGERVDHYETKRRTKDGRILDVSLTVSPVRDASGTIVGASKVARDITEQKRADEALKRSEEQLREMNRRKDEFLAMLAHELRNPLSAISSAVQVARRSSLDESLAWSTEVIERQSRLLARLIDDLLDVSRLTRGKIRLRKEVVDVGPVLNSAVDTVRPLIEERKHELTVSFRPGALRVQADPVRLEQVVVNLLTNAAKYTEAGGRIWLSAGQDGDEVVIRVRDTGIGIPPEKLPQMFELFVQDDRSLARSEGGLGIGLTLVKSLVEMQQGTVSASSDGPGKGSEFTVRLPVAACTDPNPARPAPATGDGNGSDSGNGKHVSRILIVDDNADSARGLSRLLKLLGHEVRTAHDGLEAVAVAPAYRPDVVLLDIGLPGMDGYEVARQLRQDEACRGCTIVAVSGYGQEDDRRRGREAGFDHHLVKPIDPDALLNLLCKV